MLPESRFARFRTAGSIAADRPRLRRAPLGALRAGPRDDPGPALARGRRAARVLRRRALLLADRPPARGVREPYRQMGRRSCSRCSFGRSGHCRSGCSATARSRPPGSAAARSRSSAVSSSTRSLAVVVLVMWGALEGHVLGARMAGRVPGRPARPRDDDARARERAAEPAAHGLDRGRAHDRPRARDTRRRARGRDHGHLPRRRRTSSGAAPTTPSRRRTTSPRSRSPRPMPPRRRPASRRGQRPHRRGAGRSARPIFAPRSTPGRPAIFDIKWKQGSNEVLADLGDDGAFVDDGYAKKHHLDGRLADRAARSPSGKQLTFVVKGIFDPPAGGSPFGPVTISARPGTASTRTRRTSTRS